ncbi:MAG: formyltetrahydrofolate deformylase [Spirochaetes bacterium]|nr:formyltetrahydrofolate deformylase [Spirochaetota bacterium]
MKSYILQIETKYTKGLVNNIAGVLFTHNVEIVNNHAFVEKENEVFFRRTEILGDIDEVKLLYDLYITLSEKAKIILSEKRKKDIVVLCTKEHHCLGDLLIKNYFNDFNANIKAVISNYEKLQPLVEKFDIPYHYITHKNKTREEHDKQIYDTLIPYNPEYIILAKYMRILSPFFIDKFPNRIVNIHHSFLPAFIGANPYKQAYDRGVKLIGATAHFITEELDEGPIIAQDIIKVDHKKTPADLAHEGKELEKVLLSRALELACEDRIFVTGNKTIVFE